MIGLFQNNEWITFYELLREGVKIYDADWNIIERYISEIEKIWKIAGNLDSSIKLVFREYTLRSRFSNFFFFFYEGL